MSLHRHRERYIILHMWKILNKSTSNDLHIQFNQRHRLGIQAIVLPICKTSSQAFQTLYKNSFSVKGPKLWNSIPYDLTGIKMISNPSSISSCYWFLTSRLFGVTPPQTRTPYWHDINTEKLQVSGVVGASDGLLNLNETFQRYQR